MFDIGWSEMAVILMVALIVIGPKDLPRVARQVGRWTAKARGMAREFQRSPDDMAREAELQDIKAEMEKLSRTDVRRQIEDTIDPEGELRRGMNARIELDSAPPPAAAPPPAEPALPPPPAEAAPVPSPKATEAEPPVPAGEKRP
jgi:sec-independent protein translocase protein TatB